MNSAQIKYILNENGYSTSNKAELDLGKFSIIFLDQDSNLFPDTKRTRYKFDYTNETLEIYSGRTKNGTFIYDETSRANHYVSFKLIAGFIQSSKISDIGQILYNNASGLTGVAHKNKSHTEPTPPTPPEPEKIKLSAPQLTISANGDNISCDLSWTAIRNADGYKLYISALDDTFDVGDMTSVAAISALDSTEAEMKVLAMAPANSNFTDSDWSNSVYSQQRPAPSLARESENAPNLIITDTSGLGGTYSIYRNGDFDTPFLTTNDVPAGTTTITVKTSFTISDSFVVKANDIVVRNKYWARSNESNELVLN